MTVKNNDIERKMSFSGMTFAKMLYLCGMKHKIYVASSWRNEHYPEIMAKFWLVLLVGLLSVLRMSGQTNPVFKLVKESGHFYFTASVNGVKAKLMFESGVPGFMMGHAFYEAHKDDPDVLVEDYNSTRAWRDLMTGRLHDKLSYIVNERKIDVRFDGDTLVLA